VLLLHDVDVIGSREGPFVNGNFHRRAEGSKHPGPWDGPEIWQRNPSPAVPNDCPKPGEDPMEEPPNPGQSDIKRAKESEPENVNGADHQARPVFSNVLKPQARGRQTPASPMELAVS